MTKFRFEESTWTKIKNILPSKDAALNFVGFLLFVGILYFTLKGSSSPDTNNSDNVIPESSGGDDPPDKTDGPKPVSTNTTAPGGTNTTAPATTAPPSWTEITSLDPSNPPKQIKLSFTEDDINKMKAADKTVDQIQNYKTFIENLGTFTLQQQGTRFGYRNSDYTGECPKNTCIELEQDTTYQTLSFVTKPPTWGTPAPPPPFAKTPLTQLTKVNWAVDSLPGLNPPPYWSSGDWDTTFLALI